MPTCVKPLQVYKQHHTFTEASLPALPVQWQYSEVVVVKALALLGQLVGEARDPVRQTRHAKDEPGCCCCSRGAHRVKVCSKRDSTEVGLGEGCMRSVTLTSHNKCKRVGGVTRQGRFRQDCGVEHMCGSCWKSDSEVVTHHPVPCTVPYRRMLMQYHYTPCS
jgi:hypothetical protein